MSDQEPFFERRPTSQFPSKFGPLPGIGQTSPTPNADNQMVPVAASGRWSPIGKSSMDGLEAEDRLRRVETRLHVSENSNRALLEEVVRLRSELKSTIRRNEEQLQDERHSRTQVESSVRATNDLIAQMSGRLKRAEDKLQEERSALSALVSHTKSVEQAVLSSQQELLSRRDVQTNKVDELKSQLQETTRAKDQLERVTYNIVDELRQVKGKMETQQMDLTSMIQELRSKSSKLEEENRQTLESVRKHGETQHTSEHSASQLRNQVETRLSELRDFLVELRNRQDQETQERRILEQQLQLKVGDLQAGTAEQNRRREEAMHALEVVQREKEHAAETERIKLQSKIAEIAEEVSKKILQKEIKLREETQAKFAQIEQMVHHEQESRQKYEREQRDGNEKRWDALKQLNDDELKAMRDVQKLDRTKANETMHKLNDAVNLLEKQQDEYKKQQDKIMTAEIKSRKQHEKKSKEKIDDMQEKLSVATATLQQAIGGMSAQLGAQNEKSMQLEEVVKKLQAVDETMADLQQEVKALVEDSSQAQTRSLADMEARLAAINRKITQTEEGLDNKIVTASEEQAKNLREKVESITLWQDVTQQTIREVQSQLQHLPEDIYALEEKYKSLKSELDSRVGSEADSRVRDVENLKADIDELKNTKDDDKANASDVEVKKLQEDLDECQTSIRKLAESIQTVKTVLGMKIQSEQKLRVEEVKNLQDEIKRLQVIIDTLLGNKPEPRVFIKPDNIEDRAKVEEEAMDINKWSVFGAYRWLKWKSRWLYPIWQKNAQPGPPQSAPQSRPGDPEASSSQNQGDKDQGGNEEKKNSDKNQENTDQANNRNGSNKQNMGSDNKNAPQW